MSARKASREMRFVRELCDGAVARRVAGMFVTGRVSLPAAEAMQLAGSGVLAVDGEGCRATPAARSWLKRQLLDADAFAAQHRVETRRPDGTVLNLAESPLGRLATASGGAPAFLAPHQVAAGEKLRLLVERSQLQPRVTMSYSAAHTAGGKGAGHAAELTDMAAEARGRLAEIHRLLPRDCAGVVMDVCGLMKGLQTVETERGWPRRSAKLVLRIGLEQLAQHFGLAPEAVGPESRRRRAWLGAGARPSVFE
jgi:hypothetical protein